MTPLTRENTTNDPLSFRKDVVLQIFRSIQDSESLCVLGAASMGKTQLAEFIQRPDVRSHYLGSHAGSTLLVRVDMGLIDDITSLALYRLMVKSLLETCEQSMDFMPDVQPVRRLLDSQHELAALRALEFLVVELGGLAGMKICFLFDGFDWAYTALPGSVFDILRALRDMVKYRLVYVLFLRQIPEVLRPVEDVEAFYELFSRNLTGLGPCSPEDTTAVIRRLEEEDGIRILSGLHGWMHWLSGGHPGLVRALFKILVKNNPAPGLPESPEHLARLPDIVEQCRRLWESLWTEEQQVLLAWLAGEIACSPATIRLLKIKGLLQQGAARDEMFSPLFRIYLEEPRPGRELGVFLCHAREDRQSARELYDLLKSSQGIHPWLDKEELLGGQDWDYEIDAALRKSDTVVIFLSRRAVQKEGYMQVEIRRALDVANEKPDGTIFLIPVRLEPCEVPFKMRKYQWIDWFEPGAENRLLLSLQKRAHGLSIPLGDELHAWHVTWE